MDKQNFLTGWIILSFGFMTVLVFPCYGETGLDIEASVCETNDVSVPPYKTDSGKVPSKVIVVDLPDIVPDAKKLELVYIPSGKFVMGSPSDEEKRDKNEGPQHEVTISKPFYAGKYEVTNAQFETFVKDANYVTAAEKKGMGFSFYAKKDKWGWVKGATWRDLKLHPDWKRKRDWKDHPVAMVSCNDAKAFCDWLSKKTGDKYRLPTEAEWEYVCRAGTNTRRYWGDDLNDDQSFRYANAHDVTSKRVVGFTWPNFNCEDGHAVTAPVGSFQPNDFGVHDMMGNVSEWCLDWYGAYSSEPQVDPKGPSSGTDRVFRGGSWARGAWDVRSAARDRDKPEPLYSSSYCMIGFRVVRTAGRQLHGDP